MANQGSLYDRFDQVVLLSAPLDVVLARVTHRVNGYGATPKDRAKIAADVMAYEPLLRAAVGEAYRQLAFARPRAVAREVVRAFTGHQATKAGVVRRGR